jgi:hypothetical protein
MRRVLIELVEYHLSPGEVAKAVLRYADGTKLANVAAADGTRLPAVISQDMGVTFDEEHGATIHAFRTKKEPAE